MEIKTVDDYLDKLSEIYPNMDKKDLKKIVTYCIKLFYIVNSYYCDVCITNVKDFWLYSGKLFYDSIEYFNYYLFKLKSKLRFLYKRRNIKYDGYYYFGLTPDRYQDYLNLKHKRGRPKKHFDIGKVILYKLYDECRLQKFSHYIFRVKMPVENGYRIWKHNYICTDAELIYLRDHTLHFKDILISENDYQFL